MFQKKIPAAGIYCCPKIRIFVAKFHCFCLEKAQNFPAASRRGLVIQKFPAASRRGFVVSKKISAASRRGFVISGFLRKVDSGDLQWGGVLMLSPRYHVIYIGIPEWLLGTMPSGEHSWRRNAPSESRRAILVCQDEAIDRAR